MERKKLSLEELDAIPYVDENGMQIPSQYIEREEQKDAEKFIPPHAVVLELGGRYGLAAAVINHQLEYPTQHIVIEPDPTVQSALEKNKQSHFCTYKIFQGAVSRQPLYFYSFGYCSFCSPVPNDDPIQTLTLEEIQELYGIAKFTHLVADCEGGLIDFFEENKQFLSQLEGIYFEADTKNKMYVNYEPLVSFLQEHGFVAKQTGFRQYWERVKLGSELAAYCQINATDSS